MTSSSLQDLCSTVSPDVFLESYFGKRMLIQAHESSTFSQLFTWEDLSSILHEHRVAAPRLRLFKDGQQVPEPSYLVHVPERAGGYRPQIDMRNFTRAVDAGATVIVDAVHEMQPSVGNLCSRLSEELGGPVKANVYAVASSSSAFRTHYDYHDVFIVQVAGRKMWRCFRPTAESATRALVGGSDSTTDLAELEREWEGVLEAGSVLYLPAGWWHDATAIGGESIHLTLGYSARTSDEFISSVVRRAVPTRIPSAAQLRDNAALAASVTSEVSRQLIELATSLSADDLHEFLGEHRVDRFRRKRFEPFAIQKLARPGGWTLKVAFDNAKVEDDGESLFLFHLNHRYRLNMRLKGLLGWAFAKRSFSLEEALAIDFGISKRHVERTLAYLVGLGVLDVEKLMRAELSSQP